jgi:hypothetical protein
VLSVPSFLKALHVLFHSSLRCRQITRIWAYLLVLETVSAPSNFPSVSADNILPSICELDAGHVFGLFLLTSIRLTPHYRLNAREGLREADRADTVRTNVISDLNFRGPQFTSTIEEGTAVRFKW